MSDESKTDSKVTMMAVAMVCLVVFASLAMAMSLNSLDSSWQKSAVKKGHARWVHDADGKAVWEWLPPCSDQTPKEKK